MNKIPKYETNGAAERSGAARSAAHEKFNRDINPYTGLATAYPALEPLILNRPVSGAFAAHENAAIRWKRLYTILGRAALVCILLVMMFFDYSVTLGRLYPSMEIVRVIMALVAGLGLLCQLVLIFGRVKDRWLIERFAAERLRCFKFQAFAMAAVSRDEGELAANVAAFTNERLARLEQELLGGRSALDEFAPSEHAIGLQRRELCGSLDLLHSTFAVYDSLRLEVQAQHFGEQARRSEARARTPTFLSELTFGLGALLAFCDVCVATWTGLGHGSKFWTAGPTELWFAFFTLLLFITSAVLAVYQRGSAHVADTERYKQYVREIRRIRQRGAPESAEVFFHTVDQTEQVELRELFDFCRDVSHSSYIF
jgi:hypothetical protein